MASSKKRKKLKEEKVLLFVPRGVGGGMIEVPKRLFPKHYFKKYCEIS